jgi:hypothetical protein
VTRVRSAGSIAIGDVATPGRAILVADRGTTAAGDLAGDEALILLGRGNIAFAGATTGGTLFVADSAMFALLPEAYDPPRSMGRCRFLPRQPVGDGRGQRGQRVAGNRRRHRRFPTSLRPEPRS